MLTRLELLDVSHDEPEQVEVDDEARRTIDGSSDTVGAGSKGTDSSWTGSSGM